MKNKTLVVNIHSFVDVITNSSTELFVCDTNKSIDVVKHILKDKLESYNRNADRCISFDDAFREPFIYTSNMYENKDEWAWGWECQENIGKLIIEGRSDNSIPYDLWDDINYIFNAHNYHLG